MAFRLMKPRKPRISANVAGKVAFGGKRHHVLVRNHSGAGACLRSGMALPDTFHLTAPLQGLNFTCRVIWRKGSDVGVTF